MAVIVAAFVDLDRTLIYSRNAFMLGDAPEPDVECVEHYDGAPLSFMTAKAVGLVAALGATGRLVPVTTRTVAQLARVALPGPPVPYAICTNGATILRSGVPDAEWADRVRRDVAATSAPLAEVEAGMARMLREEWTLSRRVADGMFCYSVVDRAAMPPDAVTALGGWLAERGWTASLQGRKVYAVPVSLDKVAAAREVATRIGAGTTVAAGDSLLDRSLLAWAGAAIRPGHGELASIGWHASHVEVTAALGIEAGEEIAMWLTAQMGASPE
jgi:hypothetical protein